MTRRKKSESESEPVDQPSSDEAQSAHDERDAEQDQVAVPENDVKEQSGQNEPKAGRVYESGETPRTYIGPTLPGGQLFQFTTFHKGRLPAHVVGLIEECPALQFLLVAPSQLSAARGKLEDRSSLVAAKFAEVRHHFHKGER